MKNIKTDASRFLLAAIILFIIAGITLAVYTLQSDPVEDALSVNRVINVLFIIEDEKTPLSTYVLMYYPATRRSAIFDIPSELGFITRVNRIAHIDTLYDTEDISDYENEINRLLGIELNFSIVITRENLSSMVDLIEGVEVFIPSPVSSSEGDRLILFPSGMTLLDGDKAGTYATYSIPYEDREIEMFRRQRFFLGFFNRWIQMNDRLKSPVMAGLYQSYLNTSMNRRTLIRLFDEFSYLDTDRINIHSVGGNPREVSGRMLIIPHWDGNLVKEVVRQTLEQLTRQTEDYSTDRTYTVEVLNGTAINGLAGRTAELIRSFGYDVISIGNADRNNYENTEIIHRSGDDSMVIAFADIIRCNNIRQEMIMMDEHDSEGIIQTVEYRADFTLIIGRNFNGRYVTGN